MPIFELVSLIVLGALAWLWFDSFQAHATGIEAARQACAAEDLQLLDDTVAIASLRTARDDDGRLTLRRVYEFEFSDTGDNRRRGSVVLLGRRVLVINIGLRLAPPNSVRH